MTSKMGIQSNALYLMDGTAYFYRSFYANRHLQRSDGFPTNALTLATRILLRIMKEKNPRYFLFAMDGKWPTFRHEIYENYKANRDKMPEELALQMEPMREMVTALGLPLYIAHGFEADDCIASLAARYSSQLPVVILSGDKDLKQCLGDNVIIWDPGSKEDKIITAEAFEMENGIKPQFWPDMQALTGDSSDNIPGAPGIGPKTARQIFEILSSLEEIRDRFSELPPKIQAKLESHLDDLFKWRSLTTLRHDAAPELTLENLLVKPINMKACGELAEKYELFSIRREIAAIMKERHGSLDVSDGVNGYTEAEELGAEAGFEKLEMAGGKPAPPPAALELSKPAELPPCEDLNAAVIWPYGRKEAARIAIEDKENAPEQEFAWSGSMADLCAWLRNAKMVVLAEMKSLIVDSPSWSALLADDGAPQPLDLSLASYLLNPEDGDYSWARMQARWRDQLNCGQCGPAVTALAMAKALEQTLAANDMLALYRDMELPLAPVLADMEKRGIAVDPQAFASFLEDVQRELDALKAAIFREAGGEFNLRSSQQIGEILFDRLRLGSARKTKSGQHSTSYATLEKLADKHEIVANILKFRQLDKMRSTYLAPLPRLMDRDNRIHSTFNQEATATGRLSSSNPNLQNIPVRGQLGQRMRRCFVAAPGKLLLAVDYSQIELRILADLSGEPALISAFQGGEDIHARTAALIFEVAPEGVLPDQRRMAKTINFGLLYGMGANKLGQELKITPSQARDFISRYFARLGDLKSFYEKILDGARAKGYVTTMAGRRRWLPGIFSANGQEVAQAQRQAVNSVIQGSAADVIKLAMIKVANDPRLQELDARIVLQIHDELLLEAPEASAKEACEKAVRIMESVRPGDAKLTVPLLADWGIGKNWGDAHK